MKKSVLLLFVIPAILCTELQAQSFEFRYVNKQYLLNQMLETGMYEDEFTDLYRYQQQLQEEMMRKYSEVEQLRAQLSSLSPAEQDATQKRIESMMTDLNTFQATSEENMRLKQQEFENGIRSDLDNAITEVAAEAGIDHVVPTANDEGASIILYISPDKLEEYNMTLQVLEYLQRRARE